MRASLPLTRAEKRAAVARLIGRHPDVSDRQIATQVGVSPTTVGVIRKQASKLDTTSGAARTGDRPVLRTHDGVARELSAYLTKLRQSRDLFDMLIPSRMGHHLAVTFDTELGDDALGHARQFEAWLHAAVVELGNPSSRQRAVNVRVMGDD